jgi:hypothetical protein
MIGNRAAAPRGRTLPWGRDRLILSLAGIGLVALILLVGLALLLLRGAQPTNPAASGSSVVAASVQPEDVRDRIAAQPMASLDPAAATDPDPAVRAAPPLRVPNPTGIGPAGVPAYPRTSEGAVAQLAAIDIAVLQEMSMPFTGEVHAGWVLPGGPELESWDMTANVSAFLRGARQGATKDVTTVVRAVPAGGLVKGSDGPDWVLACVLLDVHASIVTDYRMGWGHCHRMQWSNGRWQIAAGTPPAPAPSAWPGSKAAVAAGWLTWQQEGR